MKPRKTSRSAALPCPACEGQGWLVMFNTTSREYEVQRCDTCMRYASDYRAQKALARNKAGLAQALFTFCELVLESIKPEPGEAGNRLSEQRMAFIQRSLGNAMALRDGPDSLLRKWRRTGNPKKKGGTTYGR